MESCSSLGSPVQERTPGKATRMLEHMVGEERLRMNVSLEKRR